MSFPNNWIQSERELKVYQSAVEVMMRIMKWEDIDSYVTNRLVAIPLTWDLTEGLAVDEKGVKRKYFGVRYWSKNAIKEYQKSKDGKLTHEHVVERGRITRFLFDKEVPDDHKREVLGKSDNFPAVIITKEEDKQLKDTNKQSSSFGWQRYIDSKIEVYDRGDEVKLLLEKKLGSIDKTLSDYPIRGKY